MEQYCRDQIRECLAGTIPLAELECRLLEATWDEGLELADAALLYLAEYDRGHRTEGEIRELLRGLLKPSTPERSS